MRRAIRRVLACWMRSLLESTALDELVFDNRFTRELPADPDETNRPRQVLGACFSRVWPAKVRAPELVAFASEVAEELGLSPETCRSEDFIQVFSGNRVLDGMDPHATCYGGHQFGHWAGQLGDGRAINLGELAGQGGISGFLTLDAPAQRGSRPRSPVSGASRSSPPGARSTSCDSLPITRFGTTSRTWAGPRKRAIWRGLRRFAERRQSSSCIGCAWASSTA